MQKYVKSLRAQKNRPKSAKKSLTALRRVKRQANTWLVHVCTRRLESPGVRAAELAAVRSHKMTTWRGGKSFSQRDIVSLDVTIFVLVSLDVPLSLDVAKKPVLSLDVANKSIVKFRRTQQFFVKFRRSDARAMRVEMVQKRGYCKFRRDNNFFGKFRRSRADLVSLDVAKKFALSLDVPNKTR